MNRVLDLVEQAFRRRGVRMTAPRRRILSTILATKGHFTADDLLDVMGRSNIAASKATLYRTLALLVEEGHLEPREFERGPLRYEVVVGRDHHDHMICTSCGTVHEFVDEEIERLQERACEEFGFRMLGHSHRIFGLCSRCVARGRPEATAPVVSAPPRATTSKRGPRRARR